MIDFIIITGIVLVSLRVIYLAQSWILRCLGTKTKIFIKISIVILMGLAVITFNIGGFGQEWGPLFTMMGAGVIAFVWFINAILHGFQGKFKKSSIKN